MICVSVSDMSQQCGVHHTLMYRKLKEYCNRHPLKYNAVTIELHGHLFDTFSTQAKLYRLHEGGVFAGLFCLKSYTDHTSEAKFIPSFSVVSLLVAPDCCSDGRSENGEAHLPTKT